MQLGLKLLPKKIAKFMIICDSVLHIWAISGSYKHLRATLPFNIGSISSLINSESVRGELHIGLSLIRNYVEINKVVVTKPFHLFDKKINLVISLLNEEKKFTGILIRQGNISRLTHVLLRNVPWFRVIKF